MSQDYLNAISNLIDRIEGGEFGEVTPDNIRNNENIREELSNIANEYTEDINDMTPDYLVSEYDILFRELFLNVDIDFLMADEYEGTYGHIVTPEEMEDMRREIQERAAEIKQQEIMEVSSVTQPDIKDTSDKQDTSNDTKDKYQEKYEYYKEKAESYKVEGYPKNPVQSFYEYRAITSAYKGGIEIEGKVPTMTDLFASYNSFRTTNAIEFLIVKCCSKDKDKVEKDKNDFEKPNDIPVDITEPKADEPKNDIDIVRYSDDKYSKFYYTDGNVTAKENYKDNKIEQRITYQEDKKVDKIEYFDKDGNVKKIKDFEYNEDKVESIKTYGIEGKLIREELSNGERFEYKYEANSDNYSITHTDKDGTLLDKTTFTDAHIEKTYYKENGEIDKVETVERTDNENELKDVDINDKILDNNNNDKVEIEETKDIEKTTDEVSQENNDEIDSDYDDVESENDDTDTDYEDDMLISKDDYDDIQTKDIDDIEDKEKIETENDESDAVEEDKDNIEEENTEEFSVDTEAEENAIEESKDIDLIEDEDIDTETLEVKEEKNEVDIIDDEDEYEDIEINDEDVSADDIEAINDTEIEPNDEVENTDDDIDVVDVTEAATGDNDNEKEYDTDVEREDVEESDFSLIDNISNDITDCFSKLDAEDDSFEFQDFKESLADTLSFDVKRFVDYFEGIGNENGVKEMATAVGDTLLENFNVKFEDCYDANTTDNLKFAFSEALDTIAKVIGADFASDVVSQFEANLGDFSLEYIDFVNDCDQAILDSIENDIHPIVNGIEYDPEGAVDVVSSEYLPETSDDIEQEMKDYIEEVVNDIDFDEPQVNDVDTYVDDVDNDLGNDVDSNIEDITDIPESIFDVDMNDIDFILEDMEVDDVNTDDSVESIDVSL